MNDTTKTQTGASVDNTRAHNKNLIFAALAEAGIHRVTIDYDGSGDSGQIENIEAWDAANEKIPLPSSRKVQLVSENPDRPVDEFALEAAVEQLAWNYLYDNYCGWENNDGAFGTFVLNIPGRTITLEHNKRYTDSTPAPTNFERGSNGTSVPSQPFLGPEMGRLTLRLPAAA